MGGGRGKGETATRATTYVLPEEVSSDLHSEGDLRILTSLTSLSLTGGNSRQRNSLGKCTEFEVPGMFAE